MSEHAGPEVVPAEEVGPVDAGPTRHAGHAGQGSQGGRASEEPGGYDEYDAPRPRRETDEVHPDTRRAQEHLSDLKRLQAEYVNYKKRVDRDRALARELGVTQVLEALVPVLDDIHLAREHGDLEGGPFAVIADKLEAVLSRFGVTRLGEKGQPFDPAIHEALMHVHAQLDEDATTTTVVQVLQPGYKVGDRVVRPARVSVADPPAGAKPDAEPPAEPQGAEPPVEEPGAEPPASSAAPDRE